MFSQNQHYRAQCDALMGGDLATCTEPAFLAHDLAWSENGCHQVWGLGVPLWRLPGEFAARVLGLEGFPDALAFGLALFLTVWLTLSTWFSFRKTDVMLPNASRLAGAMSAAMMLLAQPAYLGMLGTRFDVYEEAMAYANLYDGILLAFLVRLAREPGWRRFWVVCGLAGVGGLVRPTVVFYGTTAVLACLAFMGWEFGRRDSLKTQDMASTNTMRSWLMRLRPISVGLVLFCLGGGLLFWTNLIRFGNGFEFGHRLNLQNLYGSMYATRFEHPYQREPLWSASREMFGLLFLTKEMSGGNFYRRDFFPGQSPTTRWREIYLTAYDWTYLPLLLGGGVAGALAMRRLWRNRKTSGEADSLMASQDREITALALWGGLSCLMLFGFYLRNSVISSRYLLDFMPGFAALMVAGWLGWHRWWGRRPAGKYLVPISLAALCGWLVWEISNLRSAYGPPRLLTWAEVQQRSEQQKAKAAQPRPSLPDVYSTATKFADYKIPYNGGGWTPETGAVKPLIILFMEDPEYLELTVTSARPGVENAVPRHVRAKIGLEFLEQESLTQTDQGWVVRFRGPKARRYQKGLQVAFVVFVPNTQLADETTPWQLLKAQWKDSNTG